MKICKTCRYEMSDCGQKNKDREGEFCGDWDEKDKLKLKQISLAELEDRIQAQLKVLGTVIKYQENSKNPSELITQYHQGLIDSLNSVLEEIQR